MALRIMAVPLLSRLLEEVAFKEASSSVDRHNHWFCQKALELKSGPKNPTISELLHTVLWDTAIMASTLGY